MNQKKARYLELCINEPSIPIFSQDWWLDTVAGPENWDVALVDSGDTVQAAMPYVLRRVWGFNIITMPLLTQTLGPWLAPMDGKYASRLAREKSLLQDLLSQLPRFGHFSQNWHHSRTNWLPFYWSGFSQTTLYTYVLQGLGDLEAVFSGLSSSYRNKIRKAEDRIEIRTDLDIDSFYRVNSSTFQRQGLEVPYSLDFLRKLDRVLSERGQRRIFSAMDGDGEIHSALYLIWDRMSAYVHMVGEDPALRSSGAGIRLIWEGIVYTSEVLQLDRFDFEGSMIESVERVRRDFGASQVPYFRVTRTPSRLLRARSCFSGLLSGSNPS